MRPVMFHLMGVPWFSWHIFFALGAAFSFFAFVRLASRFAPESRRWTLFLVFTGTYTWIFAGASLWAVWVEGFPPVSEQLSRFDSIAMSSSGGIIGGIFAFAAISMMTGSPVPRMADAAVPAALLGFAIGRVGCFLNGDDYGRLIPQFFRQWFQFFAFDFPGSVPRYPVQLVEALYCLGAFVLLVSMRPRHAGRIAGWGVLFYSSMRLVTELFRGDWRGAPVALPAGLELSPPQLIALAGFVASIAFLILADDLRVRWKTN